MADDSGVWVKIVPDDFNLSGAPGAAVISMNSVGVDNNPDGKPVGAIDLADGSYTYTDGGKTYRVLAFTTPTTRASIRLTDEARARITDEDLLMAVASMQLPDDFTGDPVKLFDRKYSKQLRNSFDVTPAVDPGLTLDVEKAGLVDALIIGGGGGSGGRGAGGAGGYQSYTNIYLSQGTNTVTVGAGGVKAGGSHSKLSDNYVAAGGGGGDQADRNQANIAGSGGSGGGGAIFMTGGSAISNQGNNGGSTTDGSNAGGGGGGASSAGADGGSSIGGAGGNGLASSITGSLVTRGGGGGGGGNTTDGSGGTGGGGNGGLSPTNGAPNTGSGGGGARGGTQSTGGSGIVIVRVEI